MNKINVLILCCVLASLGSVAQQEDSLVYASGKIFNSKTKEPVTAKITYQSIPYGNIVGILNGSTFLFPLYDNSKYAITVEAAGFAPSKYTLDPATAKDRKVIQDVELGLPSTTAPTTTTGNETKHHVGKVIRLDALIFQLRSAIISNESFPELNSVAQMMHDNPKMVIQLEGHTDTRGDAKENLKLSQQRVDAVRDYLINRGVSKTRVKTKAYGGTKPLTTENTEEAHKMNRRVEVRILEN